jgi:hypothetical protein
MTQGLLRNRPEPTQVSAAQDGADTAALMCPFQIVPKVNPDGTQKETTNGFGRGLAAIIASQAKWRRARKYAAAKSGDQLLFILTTYQLVGISFLKD